MVNILLKSPDLRTDEPQIQDSQSCGVRCRIRESPLRRLLPQGVKVVVARDARDCGDIQRTHKKRYTLIVTSNPLPVPALIPSNPPEEMQHNEKTDEQSYHRSHPRMIKPGSQNGNEYSRQDACFDSFEKIRSHRYFLFRQSLSEDAEGCDDYPAYHNSMTDAGVSGIVTLYSVYGFCLHADRRHKWCKPLHPSSQPGMDGDHGEGCDVAYVHVHLITWNKCE